MRQDAIPGGGGPGAYTPNTNEIYKRLLKQLS